MQGDWEEALPWMLLAAREDTWKEAQPPSNLLDFVNGFRYRLYMSQEVARENWARAQTKMKKR
ncbi:hypothetical protein F2P79_024489 [Pimephales promelas]|nr:hypothetical protein F2P79_024489 [Pimephales promelas]